MQKTKKAIAAARRAACLLLAACMMTLGLPLAGLAPQEQAWADDAAVTGPYETFTTVSRGSISYDKGNLDVGDTFKPGASVKYTTDGSDRKTISNPGCTFTSSNESVLQTDDGLTFTAVGIGTAEITAHYAGSDTYMPSDSSTPLVVTVYGGEFTEDGLTYRVITEPSGASPGKAALVSISADSSFVDSCPLTNDDQNDTGYCFTAPSSVVHDGSSYTVDTIGSLDHYPSSSIASSLSASLAIVDLSQTRATTITLNTFLSSTAVREFLLPDTLQTIGSSAFGHCYALKELTIPAAVTEVGSSAFVMCTALESVVFADGSALRSLGGNAFSACESLSSITLPEGLASIGYGAFDSCKGLKRIRIPSTVTTLFGDATSSTETTEGAFKYCYALEEVEIPEDSVLEDVTGAFYCCSSLKSIFLPSSVKTVTATTFARCSALESIGLGQDSNFSLDEYGILYDKDETLLYACPGACGIQDYVAPGTLQHVSAEAFRGNTTLETVTFPGECNGSATFLGEYAFDGCTSLESVVFPSGNVGGIGNFAFRDCAKLSKVDFSRTSALCETGQYTDDIILIGQYAFSNCTSLKEISLPKILGGRICSNGLTSGYDGAWHGDNVISIPVINGMAFNGCTSLERVVVKADEIDGSYRLVSTGSSAFKGCTSLKEIVYEGTQSYWLNPNKGIQNGKASEQGGPTAYWSNCGVDEPDYYYAVNYYATKDAAEADDARALNRLSRIEYKRGTPNTALMNSDKDVLADYQYYDTSAYAEMEADGAIPDPNDAAKQAGLDTTKKWVWRLSDDQCFRESLTETCYAYLVSADDFSSAFATSANIQASQFFADRCWTSYEDGFDAQRYYEDGLYRLVFGSYSERDRGALGLDPVWTASDSKGVDMSEVKIYGPDGTLVDWQDESRFDVEWFDYAGVDEDGNIKLDAEDMPYESGPALLVITPKEGSGYDPSTCLRQWLLVRVKSDNSTVESRMGGSDASYTFTQASRNYNIYKEISYTAPYTVSVNPTDTKSAFIAAGLAGVVQGMVEVSSSVPVGTVKITAASKTLSLSAQDGESIGQTSAFDFDDFEYNRNALGASKSSYPWSDTAILVSANNLNLAQAAVSYAYCKRSPVFFIEEDGSVSNEVIEQLSKFEKAVVIGDDSLVSSDTLQALAEGFGEEYVSRIESVPGDVCGLSIAVAETLLADDALGILPSTVAVCDASDPLDALAAQDLAGYEKGVTLLSYSVSDSKRIARWLRKHRDDVSQVRIYGRDTSLIDGNGFELTSVLSANLWNERVDFSGLSASSDGDTLVLSNIQYELLGNNAIGMTGLTVGGDAAANVSYGDELSYDGNTYKVTKVCDGFQVDMSRTAAAVEDSDDLVYTGKAIKPAITVTFNGENLVEGVDYEVSEYSNNVDAGQASAVLKGIGNFGGCREVTFTIAKADVDMSGVKFASKTVTYTGKAQSLAVTGLPQGVGVEYSGNGKTTVGTYTVTATFSCDANHAPSVDKLSAKLTISKAAQTVKASKGTSKAVSYKKASKGTYKGKLGATKTVTAAQMKTKFGLSAKGALVFAKANSKGGTKITVSSAGKVTIKKGLKAGTYKVKVKVTAKATANYKASSAKYVWLTVKVR